MATSPSGPFLPSRRAILTGAAAGFAGLFLPVAVDAAAAQAAPLYQLTADGIQLDVDAAGVVTVLDGSGVERLRLAHFMIKDSVLGQVRTYGGTPSLVTVDGADAVQIAYNMPSGASTVTVIGTFQLTARRAHLRWAVSGSPTLLPDGYMFSRALVANTAPEQYTALTKWSRDDGGGIPFESNDGGVYQETFDTTRAYFSLAKTTPKWTNATWVHAPATAIVDGVSTTDVALVLGEVRPAAAKTIADQRATGVEIWTDNAFNIWDDTSAPQTVHAQITNGTPTAMMVNVTFWAKDFAGASVVSETFAMSVPAGGVIDHDFTITTPHPGVTFTEVSAAAGDASALARTTLAVLGPYTYTAGAASLFGIANYPWLHKPSKQALLTLMHKIGVQRVRIAYEANNPFGYIEGMTPAELDAAGFEHNMELGQIPLNGTPEEGVAWAKKATTSAITAGAKYFEVGNEVNTPFMTGQTAAAYVRQGLAPARAELTAQGSPIKVLNAGTAGADYVWLENFHAAGGWDLIDGLAIHPGRGNFTPDHTPDPATWDPGANGDYWNFLGSLRKANELMAAFGQKELWLTEAYAPTRPNHWWNDSLRQAAENTLLSFALALSEGVHAVNWYQLHDSTVHHPQEADPVNPEYHFGLMNRDTSAKPTLLAYATSARAFDQAKFVRWLEFDDPLIKGLQFSVPGGSGFLHVLWTRHDGYILNKDHGAEPWYKTPEPWVDHWPTKTTLSLKALNGSVREVDVIGGERIIPVAGGKAAVTLDGAPRLYWGLKSDCDGDEDE
jgi:hypothetical protein